MFSVLLVAVHCIHNLKDTGKLKKRPTEFLSRNKVSWSRRAFTVRTFYNISHAGDSKLACACVEGPGAPGNGANKSGANHPVPRRAPCLQHGTKIFSSDDAAVFDRRVSVQLFAHMRC